MVLVCDKLSCHDDHLCHNFFKSHHAYLWVGHEQVSLAYAQSLCADCDLDLWPSDMVLFATHRLVMMIIRARLFSNPTMHNKGMGRTRTGFTEVYAESLSADCDLDL